MEEMNKAYATFEERDRIASLGAVSYTHLPDKIHRYPNGKEKYPLQCRSPGIGTYPRGIG